MVYYCVCYYKIVMLIVIKIFFVMLFVVQLLHKLSIHADDGPMKLMKVS